MKTLGVYGVSMGQALEGIILAIDPVDLFHNLSCVLPLKLRQTRVKQSFLFVFLSHKLYPHTT